MDGILWRFGCPLAALAHPFASLVAILMIDLRLVFFFIVTLEYIFVGCFKYRFGDRSAHVENRNLSGAPEPLLLRYYSVVELLVGGARVSCVPWMDVAPRAFFPQTGVAGIFRADQMEVRS